MEQFEITEKQQDKIFEFAKHELDAIIKEKGLFDDTNTNNLEDLILDATTTYFEAEHNINIDFTDYEHYDTIIDLTSEFITWLFESGKYDEKFYDKTLCIKNIKGGN